jgi:hypothetical protein
MNEIYLSVETKWVNKKNNFWLQNLKRTLRIPTSRCIDFTLRCPTTKVWEAAWNILENVYIPLDRLISLPSISTQSTKKLLFVIRSSKGNCTFMSLFSQNRRLSNRRHHDEVSMLWASSSYDGHILFCSFIIKNSFKTSTDSSASVYLSARCLKLWSYETSLYHILAYKSQWPISRKTDSDEI